MTEFIEKWKSENDTDEFRVSIVFLPYGNLSFIEKSKTIFKKIIEYEDPPKRTLFAGFEMKDELEGDETYSFKLDGRTYAFTEQKMKKILDCFIGCPSDCKNRFLFISFRIKDDCAVKESVRWIKGRLNTYTTYKLILNLMDDQYNNEESEKRFLRDFPSLPALDFVLSLPFYHILKIESINFSHYRWKGAKLKE